MNRTGSGRVSQGRSTRGFASPNVVAREDLRKRLWDEDTFVEFDHGLNARFIGPVEELAASRLSPTPVDGDQRNRTRSDSRVGEIDRLQASASRVKAAAPTRRFWARIAIYAVLAAVALAGAVSLRLPKKTLPISLKYTQITNFSDAVFSPAISADGCMIALIRGSDTMFPTLGEIYTKLLPGFPISGFDRQIRRRTDYNDVSESCTQDIMVRRFLFPQAKR